LQEALRQKNPETNHICGATWYWYYMAAVHGLHLPRNEQYQRPLSLTSSWRRTPLSMVLIKIT